jgi:ABC-type transport system involved in cytochrome c biogenesis permease subunit
MSIVDGDTFSVLVAVLDTQFWLSTHVVCITIGYAVTFAAGFIALAYILATMLTPAMNKDTRRLFSNIIYGVTCFALFFSFFGTVLGGLWGDDSWGRFWGWDPKENGALMIVLWSALLLHARWGGLVKERGIAILAVLGNIVVLWSWKGVNSMGVGLHAYAASEDNTVFWILMVGAAHLVIAVIALVPTKFWFSHIRHA